jgi:hypothetical protein
MIPPKPLAGEGAAESDKVPKAQVRRIAYFCGPGSSAKLVEYEAFLRGVARGVSKKPVVLGCAFLAEAGPGGGCASSLAEAVKASGAAGAVALAAGFPEQDQKAIEELFSQEDIFLRWVGAEDAGKRPAAMDLIFEIMLLRAG